MILTSHCLWNNNPSQSRIPNPVYGLQRRVNVCRGPCFPLPGHLPVVNLLEYGLLWPIVLIGLIMDALEGYLRKVVEEYLQ